MTTNETPQPTPDLRTHLGRHGIPFTREIDVYDRFEAPAAAEALRDLRRTVENACPRL